MTIRCLRQFLTLLYRFRWVSCQLDTLQHCFPPNLPRFLNEFPETLDETYERILRGIHRAQRDDAHRLLQCLAVAARPLRVEEIAELLAFDCQAPRSGGIPKLENWRWDNHEEAVLSTCSSLIAIVGSGASRAVQFSHFSVKGYLTSPRLARHMKMFLDFISISMRRIRLWRRRAWGHYSGWTNTLPIAVPKGFLWLNTLLSTGWATHNSRMCHHTYRMKWMIYLTRPSHISRRGSGCTTLTNPGAFFRTSCSHRHVVMAPLFTMLRSVDSTSWRRTSNYEGSRGSK
jgi:hypothetical protein